MHSLCLTIQEACSSWFSLSDHEQSIAIEVRALHATKVHVSKKSEHRVIAGIISLQSQLI